MTVNPHITAAIAFYARTEQDFHAIVTWHLLHGVVMITPEFLCLGHYCRHDNLGLPLPIAEANTAFVTYFAGDMRGLKAIAGHGLEHIAFERGFRNERGRKIYSMEKFKHLIH